MPCVKSDDRPVDSYAPEGFRSVSCSDKTEEIPGASGKAGPRQSSKSGGSRTSGLTDSQQSAEDKKEKLKLKSTHAKAAKRALDIAPAAALAQRARAAAAEEEELHLELAGQLA